MAMRVELKEAQARLAELVAAAATEGPIIILQDGAPVAELVATARLAGTPAEHLGSFIQEVQRRHADIDPDELAREIAAAVEAACQELYEERRAEGRA